MAYELRVISTEYRGGRVTRQATARRIEEQRRNGCGILLPVGNKNQWAEMRQVEDECLSPTQRQVSLLRSPDWQSRIRLRPPLVAFPQALIPFQHRDSYQTDHFYYAGLLRVSPALTEALESHFSAADLHNFKNKSGIIMVPSNDLPSALKILGVLREVSGIEGRFLSLGAAKDFARLGRRHLEFGGVGSFFIEKNFSTQPDTIGVTGEAAPPQYSAIVIAQEVLRL